VTRTPSSSDAGRPSIVFLNRFYWPDVAATSQMLTDLAEDLAARGWLVTIVASQSSYDGAQVALPAEEWHVGVRIIRVKTSSRTRHRKLARLIDYATYLGAALACLLKGDSPRVVVAMSDPPFSIAIALFAGRVRGALVVYWVQDLFPEIAAALGVMSPRGLPFILVRRLAAWMHCRCDAVIALGPQMMRALIAAGADSKRTRYVHNWADLSGVRPVPAAHNEFIRVHRLEGKFVVLYSGNAGRAHPFGAVLHAARALRSESEFLFLFIGGGQRIPSLKRECEQSGLNNVRFLNYVPRSELASSLSSASVSLVTEDPSVIGLLVPSKTYGILASGRPLLFVGASHSDVARVVREADCGIVIEPEDGEALVHAIRRLRDDVALRQRLGEKARKAAEERFGRSDGTRNWECAVLDLLSEQLRDFPIRLGDSATPEPPDCDIASLADGNSP
jgi:colanic acid biosynthesis glycosyl transferase WcaI